MQDELYGGARGRAPKGQTAKEKADELKTKIRNNDADFLEKYMQYGYEKTRLDKTVKIGNKYEKMLEIVRNYMDEQLRTGGYLDSILYSEEVAKTVTRDNVIVWLRRHNDRLVKERKEDAERNQAVAQAKAEKLKKQIRENDDKFLDKYMMQAGEETHNVERDSRHDKMLEIVRKNIGISLREDLGLHLADEVANTVTKEIVTDWMQKKIEAKRSATWNAKPKEEIIKEAFEGSRGSLIATLKRARMLTSTKITMDDVRKWRLENTNKEKKTDKKAFNSWVANKRKEEYQVDLFFFQDLKKKRALQELLEERAKGGDEEAKAALDAGIPVPDAYALTEATGGARPKAKAKAEIKLSRMSLRKPKAKAKAKADPKVSARSKELKRIIKSLSWEFESGLLVVDTFTKMIAVVPMKNRDWETLKPSLETAFNRLGGKPYAIYSDAEAALTGYEAAGYFQEQKIVHNITLGHAPIAERMIGVIKERIVHKLKEPWQMWWNYVDDVVKEYNSENVSRSTKMTPNEAAKAENQQEVKTNLESIRKSDNPQPVIEKGDEVRVMVKKKFDKSYVPNWTDKTYKVTKKQEWNHVYLHDDTPKDPQTMYGLSDPTNDLPRYKDRFMRHELLRVK